MKKKTQVALAAFAVILAILFASSSARADTYTYSYISQGQLDLGGLHPCSPCRMQISFTVANALAPNTAYMWTADGSGTGNPLDPLTIIFDPFAGGNDASLIVGTDKSGNIEDWFFALTNTTDPLVPTCTTNASSQGENTVAGSVFEMVSLSNCTDVFEDAKSSVSFQFQPLFGPAWTETTNVTTMNVPEPSTMMLLGIGLLLPCMKMRRRANHGLRAEQAKPAAG